MPLIEIVDIDRDGMFDLVFMAPNGDLIVLYNKQDAQPYNA